MKMFWVTFEEETSLTSRLGYGITAVDAGDLMRIIWASSDLSAFADRIASIKEIRFEDIEKNHVLPNAGVHVVRGIWYPQGTW